MNSKSIVNDNMNTPETDEAERMAYSQEYMVPTEFARRLERERDEAMEWKQIAEIRKDTIIQYQNRAVKAEEELKKIQDGVK